MIKIYLSVENGKVVDAFTFNKTTLTENSIILRRLEEIKLELLKINYKSDFETGLSNKKDN